MSKRSKYDKNQKADNCKNQYNDSLKNDKSCKNEKCEKSHTDAY